MEPKTFDEYVYENMLEQYEQSDYIDYLLDHIEKFEDIEKSDMEEQRIKHLLDLYEVDLNEEFERCYLYNCKDDESNDESKVELVADRIDHKKLTSPQTETTKDYFDNFCNTTTTAPSTTITNTSTKMDLNE
ncbi:hypothetical protein Hesp052 [Hemileuca sp. nucleopolyhedrovirus]|uniref:Uncharacterized protein n=1 Tax=Hemileuca sp. nucleopolyhedrovirus TaxID=1367203 RepID=S5MQB9_9ABAC|nr:hypothetical protein Hesp052 [Hemileuca sp. nucleopolyhedrovirus]AGR56804.1 hypothetical protein Hesp052 [Hemileuca sp. nucleopolyhedrovirus]